MHHLIRDDSRGMLSIPEALWQMQQVDAPPSVSPRVAVARALVALAAWLAPAVTEPRLLTNQ